MGSSVAMGKTGVEYADYQITVYNFCTYNCNYCFWRVPLMKNRLSRFEPKPLIEAFGLKKAKKPMTIVVSFTSDPYQPIEKSRKLTRSVLDVLADTKHTVLVLTKNPMLALRDLDIMARNYNIWLGTTIISVGRYRVMEPYTPSVSKRIEALRIAKANGLRTWLSVEPIIPMITDIDRILSKTVRYVDWYVFGRLNYARQLRLEEPSDEYYRDIAYKIMSFMEAHNYLYGRGVKKYYFKKELLKTVEKEAEAIS